MTWHTSEGDRVLAGAEAELVRDALGVMVDKVSDNVRYDVQDLQWDFGVPGFDGLTPTQQVTLVNIVATNLLTQTPEMPELTATNEAAVYAVFRMLATEIEIEIDTEEDREVDADGTNWKTYWRSRTLAAFRECFGDELDDEFSNDDSESEWMPPQDATSANLAQWDWIVESLADRILWDRDFEMAGEFLDTEPATAGLMRQMLGIEDDYYSEAAADVGNDHAEQLLQQTRSITHRRPR